MKDHNVVVGYGTKGRSAVQTLISNGVKRDSIVVIDPRAQAIVEPLSRLLAHARKNNWVVVFSNDAHHPDDPELKVWGEHAMEGTPGAQVIPALEPRDGDIISPKRGYGAFDGTGLDEQLRELGVGEVVITGQHTHICVRHSSYEALMRGYEITVPSDAVAASSGPPPQYTG